MEFGVAFWIGVALGVALGVAFGVAFGVAPTLLLGSSSYHLPFERDAPLKKVKVRVYGIALLLPLPPYAF